ncbi:hypothetical protein [Haloterrigena alkaliphila]|uniref:Uncharacterized protein n=1 Tax=Haloterrigena alkaliphila TaxID=2816475 RepID=A0A8A2VKA3_9EURY|nr:hypothetical protein [Haloterrigena alkaliphila]QSX00753.1 hypothetical protein J0X25_07290 [Haloterrigena alkaliphila]
MDSSDAAVESTDRSRSSWAVIPAVVLAVLLGSSLLFLVTSLVESSVAVGGIVILALAAAGALWRRAVAPTADTDDPSSDVDAGDRSGGDGTESNVWNAIPPWQYDGRHVESGGLTRGEQERALHEIQRQADELDEQQ